MKYSPGGEQVEVEISAPGPDTARVAVRDHGLGIPPERRAQIFDRFYQAHADRHRSGLGLGLSSAARSWSSTGAPRPSSPKTAACASSSTCRRGCPKRAERAAQMLASPAASGVDEHLGALVGVALVLGGVAVERQRVVAEFRQGFIAFSRLCQQVDHPLSAWLLGPLQQQRA